MPQKVIFAV